MVRMVYMVCFETEWGMLFFVCFFLFFFFFFFRQNGASVVLRQHGASVVLRQNGASFVLRLVPFHSSPSTRFLSSLYSYRVDEY